MTDTMVTVRASFERQVPAERATVTLRVVQEGTDRSVVTYDVAATAARIRESVQPLRRTDGPVTWFSAGEVQTTRRNRWDDHGAQLPTVFSASARFAVKFSDVAILAEWLGETTADPLVVVDRVDWSLTDETRSGLIDEVRSGAVQEALARATTYAEAIGLRIVAPVEIAEAGLLPGGAPAAPSVERMRAYSPAGEVGLELTPEDVSVGATVDVRFLAGKV